MSKKQQKRKRAKATQDVKKSGSLATYLPIIFILIVTAGVFSGSISNDFVNWDDDVNILENDNLNGFTAENIGRIFHFEHGRVIGNYNPLPIFTFAVEKAVFGLNPKVMHTTNLLLHLLCVFFVYLLGRRLGLSLPAAGFLALLFGIHPMRVESVAWITERKDVLFGVFYLAAMLTYLSYLKQQKRNRFWYTVLLFIFALFSKIQAVSLPLTLLVLDYWQRRDLRLNLVIEKIPFFALSLLFGLAGIYFLGEDGSLEDATNYNIFQRLLVGAYSYVVYLIKSVVPYRMSPLYPYPASLSAWFYAAPLGVAAVVGLFVTAWKKDWRPVVFGLAFFTFNIMFLLQILGAGQGYLADRFTYIAYFGLFFTAAYGLNYALQKFPQKKNLLLGGLTVVLTVYAIVSFQQVKIWENGRTLWTHVLQHYNNVTTPFVNLGHYHRDRKETEKAVENYSEALQINGKKGEIYNSRGKLYFETGQNEKAMADFNQGLAVMPDINTLPAGKRQTAAKTYAELHVNKSAVLGTLGNYEKSLEEVNKGLGYNPDFLNGYMNRSKLYTLLDRPRQAMQDYDKIVKMKPGDDLIWYERGQTANRLENPQKALESLNRAIQLNPNRREYYKERARAHYKAGNTAAAQEDMRRAEN